MSTSPLKKVPFFNYQALYMSQRDELLKTMDDVCQRGAYILQRDLEELERNLAEFLGCRHVIGVANGTDGLIIAFKAAGIQPGDEVILPSHTYVATAASVHLTGGKPVLVECGPDHMISADAILKAITPKTKFLMPVQVNGRTCDMDKIMKIAADHKLTVIEDAAQALGSKFGGQCAGTFGLAGMFSFYPAKLLGCFGDGGALSTNDDAMADRMRLWRDHGRNPTGEVVGWGLNSRLDNLQAAILNLKLKSYPQDILRRREIAAMYHSELGKIEQLTLPPGPDANSKHFDVYQNFELEADRRDQLKTYLAEKGVGTIIQWAGKAVHQLKGLGFENVKLPITEQMTSRFLMLPMHVALSNEDVSYVCQQISDFYKKT